jgi:rhomboid protease GluP
MIEDDAFSAQPESTGIVSPVEQAQSGHDDDAGDDPDDIPTISDAMLHRERVDFEAGMKVFPPVTIGLMLACAAVYIRQLSIGGLDNPIRVVETGAMDRARVLAGDIWRLISAGFMHANAEHLIGNLVLLFVLGMACEHAFGHGPFLFLYLAACATGSVFAMQSSRPEVGASGAIFGLAGALITMIMVHRSKIEIRDHRVSIVLIVWAIYNLFLGAFSPVVSNAAHLGGLLGGSILGLLLAPVILNQRSENTSGLISKLEAGTATIALASTFLFFLPHLR